MPIMEGLEECMADRSVPVFMCNATDDPEREAHHVRSLLGKRVDGIVVTSRRADRRPRIEAPLSGPPILYVFSQTDELALSLPMPVERIYANPHVRADIGRVGLKRGPLLYCVEEVDNPSTPVPLLRLPRNAQPGAEVRQDLFDGAVAILSDAVVEKPGEAGGPLYQPQSFPTAPARLVATPYYLWNNRGPNRMAVWLPEA
jgi:Beta-L-arabinofuranosidase, GH127